MAYAENTSVSVESSRAEIERTLARYGADGFMYGWDGDHAMLAFRASGRHIRFNVEMPPLAEFRHTPAGRRERSARDQHAAREKAMRQRWRALALVVKAKLEAVESGITTFEEEFLAHIVLPDGQTFGAWAGPQIADAYDSAQMPALLPAGGTT